MEITSPCVKICELDEHKTLCIGCFRTVEEIGEWRLASQDRQLEILTASKARRKATNLKV